MPPRPITAMLIMTTPTTTLLPLALQVPEQEPLRPEPAAVGEAPTLRKAVYHCAGLRWC